MTGKAHEESLLGGTVVPEDTEDGHWHKGHNNHDLTLVRDMGDDSRYNLQIIHPVQFFGFFPIPVADPALRLIEGEPLDLQEQTDQVFASQLGLLLGGRPDLAMDQEARVTPARNFLHQGLRDELLPKEKREDLPGEHLSQGPSQASLCRSQASTALGWFARAFDSCRDLG